MYYAAAVVALGFLIVVHEAGHYFVARWCGMRVERFSIGFGPGILKRKSKRTGTVFQLAPIPFGGFVEIRGMNIAEEIDPDDAQAYPNRPAWQRFVTIFAGPGTNYLSAVLIAFALFTCNGDYDRSRVYVDVDKVLDGYEAAGKLKPNDRILKVDGVELLANGDGPSLNERVAAKKGQALKLTVRRDNVELDVEITPLLSKEKEPDYVRLIRAELRKQNVEHPPSYLIGIQFRRRADLHHIGVLQSAWRALEVPVETTKTIGAGLYGIIRGTEEADPGGPVRIADEFRKAFELGFRSGIELLITLSVYLGLFNLFPLPALDGGRLVFLGYEMVTRRRANPKIEAMVHMSGIMLLGIVMILVTLNDCSVI